MATLYVDLSLQSGGAGTPADPYGRDDFLLHTNMVHSVDHQYFIRGSADFDSSNVIINSQSSNQPSFSAWSANDYGPWRIGCQKFVANKALLLEGAFIESAGDLMVGLGNPLSIIRNSYLRNNGGTMIIRRAEGSSLVGRNDARLYIGSTSQLYETTVDHILQLDVDETGLEIGHSSLVFPDLAFTDISA